MIFDIRGIGILLAYICWLFFAEIPITADYVEKFSIGNYHIVIGISSSILDSQTSLLIKCMNKDHSVDEDIMLDFMKHVHEAFYQFQDNVDHQTIVAVRRQRALEIKQLIADTEPMTLEAFNKEIWPIETQTLIGDMPIRLTTYLDDGKLNAQAIQQVRDALEHGQLTMHGNYVWGSATRIYGAQRGDNKKNAEALINAMQILRDTTLSPLEKAYQLTREVFGFGSNIATGLVMLCYPQDMALCNTISREVMIALGYHIGRQEDNYTQFMTAASKLKSELQAADFLQLDFFVYLLKRRLLKWHRVWWVNQGTSYKTDREHQWLATILHDVRGNTPFHWKSIHDLRPGDVIIHYSNSTLTAISRVLSEPEKINQLLENQNPRDFDVQVRTTPYYEINSSLHLDAIPSEIRQAEWHGAFNSRGLVNTGYLYPITPAILSIDTTSIRSALEQMERNITPSSQPSVIEETLPPTKRLITDLATVTFLDEIELQEIENLLRAKQQIILEGPPGAGKTFVADLVARYLTDNPFTGESNDQVRLIQFHQSYGYEDFVQGIRPVMNAHGDLTYALQDGIFKRLCDDARKSPNKEFVLIIDEINRGNIARIFGELLLLLEYRDDGVGQAKSVLLPYATPNESPFSIPANIYLIGTMNTADRSLAQIDYALRRRFTFFRLMPVINGEATVFQRWLESQERFTDQQRQSVLALFIAINQLIEKYLGDDFQIGHSYFMNADLTTQNGLTQLWRYSIIPLIREYFYNQHNQTEILAEFQLERFVSREGAINQEV